MGTICRLSKISRDITYVAGEMVIDLHVSLCSICRSIPGLARHSSGIVRLCCCVHLQVLVHARQLPGSFGARRAAQHYEIINSLPTNSPHHPRSATSPKILRTGTSGHAAAPAPPLCMQRPEGARLLGWAGHQNWLAGPHESLPVLLY